MKHRIMQAMLAGVLFAASAVDAQTISVASATGSPGGGTAPTPIPVTFTRNAAVPIADFTARVTFSSANFVVAAAGAAQPEGLEINAVVPLPLGDEERGDEVAADDEEHLDAQEAAGQPAHVGMVGDDSEDGHGAQTIEARKIGQARAAVSRFRLRYAGLRGSFRHSISDSERRTVSARSCLV